MTSRPLLLLLWAALHVGGSANSIRRASSFVVPTTGSAHSLTLSTYVTDATDLHFATVRGGHAPLQAVDIKGAAARRSEEHENSNYVSDGIVHAKSVHVDGAKKIEERLSGLEPNSSYDVYLVTEVPLSNGVFGSVLSVLGATTHPAAPQVSETSATPVNGSATAVMIHVALSSPGIAHIAIRPSGRPDAQTVTIEDIVNTRSHSHGTTFVHERGFRWDALTADIMIDDLLPATVYDLSVVTEAVGEGAVFGAIQQYESSVTTHAQAPDITSMSCEARKSSSSQLELSYELHYPSTEPHLDQPATRSAAAYEVHYIVSSASVPEVVQQGSLILSKSDDTNRGDQPEIEPQHQHTIKNLQAGTPYDVTMVIETVGSNGVFGKKARVLSCSTHGEAPDILTATAQPLNGTVDTFRIYVEMKGEGDVHYFIVPVSRAGPLRQTLTQGRTPTEIHDLAKSTIEMESPSLFREGFIRAQRGSDSMKETVVTMFEVHGLTDNEAYAIALIPETIGSFGVYGPPFRHIVEASTNENASEITLIEARPAAGSTSSVLISLSMSKPADILHLCTTDARVVHKNCFEVDREQLVPIPQSVSNFLITLANLTEDTTYEVKAFAESSKRNGVYSKSPQSTSVRTHRAAPLVLSVHASPIDASVDGVMIQAETSEPAVIHYVAIPRTESTAKDEADAEVTMGPAQIAQCLLGDEATKDGRSNDYRMHDSSRRRIHEQRGHVPRHHDKKENIRTSASTQEVNKRCGNAVMNRTSIALAINGLSANTTYDIYVVTEALPLDISDERTQVYGSPSFVNARTHDIAPTIVKSTASPVPHRTDSITISANLSRPGIVHYHLTNIDFADPAFIRGGKDLSQEVRRGSFVVRYEDMGMEILNGTNETTPMQPLVFASNITVEGLTDSTTYHVSLTTETQSSNGVYGEFPAPLLATTHSPPPNFVDGSLRVAPTPGSSTSISVHFQLNQLGEVHYALFFRGLVQDRCPPHDNEKDPGVQKETDGYCDNECGNETDHTQWPPVHSTFDLASLTADVFKAARTDELGGGVWENGTLSVSREDVLKLKSTEKVIDKLPPNAMFDLCLVPETAGSDGIFANVSCHHITTHADYTNQSRMFDEAAIHPVDGTTDSLSIRLDISKLLHVSPREESTEESGLARLENLTGRIPYFILIDGREGRSELSHNSLGSNPSDRRGKNRDVSPFKLAVPGTGHVVAAGNLTGITQENATHVVVEHVVDGLRGNHPYYFFFAYETAHSDGVFTSVNPHRHQREDNASTKAHRHQKPTTSSIEVKTHESAPTVSQLEAIPTYGNTTRVTVKAGISCESCTEAIVHLVIANQGCEPPETRDVAEVLTAHALRAFELEDPCALPLLHKRIVVNMTDHTHHSSRHRHSGNAQIQSGIEEDIQDDTLLKPNTTYVVYVATETVNSRGVVSEAFQSTLVKTHPVAPLFNQLSVQPRKGTTTELILRFDLDQPGEVHYVLGKSGNPEFNVTSPYNVSAKSLPGVRDSKFHDYGRDVVRSRRSLTVEKSGVMYVEIIEYLEAGTAYDIYIVAETAQDSAIYGKIYDFCDISTYQTPPTLLAHTAFPTPGTVDSLTVGFRVEEGIACSVHASVMTSQLWDPTSDVAAGSSTFGNRLAMVDHLVTRATFPVNGSSRESWREFNLSVPYAGTNYTVFLVTETKDSDGVFGTVASHTNVASHHYPPNLVNVSVRAADARVDALAVELTVSRSDGAHIEYAVLRHGESFTRSTITTIGRVDVNGSSSTAFVIGGLEGRTAYDVYFRMETFESGGVQSEWTLFPITARTHGLPAEVLESVECDVYPSCDTIGRHACLEVANVCGECFDDYEGIRGSSNVPCQRRQEPQSPVSTITISGVRFNPEHTQELHSMSASVEPAPSEYNEEKPSEDEASSHSIGELESDMCPSNARLVAPGQCECDSGYDVDELGGGCVLQDVAVQALGVELTSHIG